MPTAAMPQTVSWCYRFVSFRFVQSFLCFAFFHLLFYLLYFLIFRFGLSYFFLLSSSGWEENFAKLKKFREAHGSVNISRSENRHLHTWCYRQRQRRQQNAMPLHQQQLLDGIGFSWTLIPKYRAESEELPKRWMENYNALKNFQLSHGHCRVPSKEYPELSVMFRVFPFFFLIIIGLLFLFVCATHFSQCNSYHHNTPLKTILIRIFVLGVGALTKKFTQERPSAGLEKNCPTRFNQFPMGSTGQRTFTCEFRVLFSPESQR